ncbi:hypothetical protein HY251_19375, partial [bacterium]|nr:hypothetical protein [bacterium]
MTAEPEKPGHKTGGMKKSQLDRFLAGQASSSDARSALEKAAEAERTLKLPPADVPSGEEAQRTL